MGLTPRLKRAEEAALPNPLTLTRAYRDRLEMASLMVQVPDARNVLSFLQMRKKQLHEAISSHEGVLAAGRVKDAWKASEIIGWRQGPRQGAQQICGL